MPNRFDKAIEELKHADLTPSQRLTMLAAEVIRMAEELKTTATALSAEENHDNA